MAAPTSSPDPAKAAIAVLNAGSSSIKFALYDADASERLILRGRIEEISNAPHLAIVDADGKKLTERSWAKGALDHRGATDEILRALAERADGRQVLAVGHRVVHGGVDYVGPVRVTPSILAKLETLIPLAPLHQPHNLSPIQVIAERQPNLPQIACFDTAFHRGQPPLAQAFALPRALGAEGVRRYGFHGLSYEFVAARFAELAPDAAHGRIVIAHLGNGASLCALDGGSSRASTMGFTAVDGLMMGTRCGAIDPGVIVYLMDRHGMDARAIEALIYRKSGLLGVSGVSSDMRTLRASKAPEAAEAIALFVYRIIREIGSMAAAIGGLDALVFTGGIGENDSATRAEVIAGCAWLGLAVDPERNAAGERRISPADGRATAWVIPTDEERMIARHCRAIMRS